jgi:hypothetical protein
VFQVEKNIIGIVVVIVCIVVGAILIINNQHSNAEEFTNVGGKLVSEKTMNEYSQKTFQLASFIQENNSDTNSNVKSIELDVKNFPKRLIYIEVLPGKSINPEKIKEHYNEIIKMTRNKSILNENEEVEIHLYEERIKELPKTSVDTVKINKEMSVILENIGEGLKNYDVVGDIQLDYQELIVIQTSIDGLDKSDKEIAKEIEEKVKNVLKSEKLSSVSQIESYKIYIENKDGEKLN